MTTVPTSDGLPAKACRVPPHVEHDQFAEFHFLRTGDDRKFWSRNGDGGFLRGGGDGEGSDRACESQNGNESYSRWHESALATEAGSATFQGGPPANCGIEGITNPL